MSERQVDDGELADLRTAVEGGDAAARIALGRALAARGAHDQAVDVLLQAVADSSTREEARAAVLELFTALGDDHPQVRRGRPRLASALFA